MKQDLYSPERIKEFFELVENMKMIPSLKYLSFNKDKILKLIQEENYKKIYPLACELILKEFEIKPLSFEEKALELFDYVEGIKRMVTESDSKKFSNNNENMYFFWNNKKSKIIEYFNTNNFKDIYPFFNDIVIISLLKKRIRTDKILHLFFDFVSLDNSISPLRNILANQTMVEYWNINKEILYYMAINTKYKDIYPIVCSIIIEQYNYEEDIKIPRK